MATKQLETGFVNFKWQSIVFIVRKTSDGEYIFRDEGEIGGPWTPVKHYRATAPGKSLFFRSLHEAIARYEEKY